MIYIFKITISASFFQDRLYQSAHHFPLSAAAAATSTLLLPGGSSHAPHNNGLSHAHQQHHQRTAAVPKHLDLSTVTTVHDLKTTTKGGGGQKTPKSKPNTLPVLNCLFQVSGTFVSL